MSLNETKAPGSARRGRVGPGALMIMAGKAFSLGEKVPELVEGGCGGIRCCYAEGSPHISQLRCQLLPPKGEKPVLLRREIPPRRRNGLHIAILPQARGVRSFRHSSLLQQIHFVGIRCKKNSFCPPRNHRLLGLWLQTLHRSVCLRVAPPKGEKPVLYLYNVGAVPLQRVFHHEMVFASAYPIFRERSARL